MEESDCMGATSWPQRCKAASPSQQAHWSHTSFSESLTKLVSTQVLAPRAGLQCPLHSVPAPAQAAMLRKEVDSNIHLAP